jgi:SAM-dependent methyltransferase
MEYNLNLEDVKKENIPYYHLKSNISENQKILDVGCATGHLGDYLNNSFKYIELIGIDNNEDTLKKADDRKIYKKLKEVDLNLMTNEMDEFEDYFDIIILSDVVEDLNRPILTLKKLSKLLKKNGNFLIHVSNIANSSKYNLPINNLKCKDHNLLDETQLKFSTTSTFISELLKNNLHIDKLEYTFKGSNDNHSQPADLSKCTHEIIDFIEKDFISSIYQIFAIVKKKYSTQENINYFHEFKIYHNKIQYQIGEYVKKPDELHVKSFENAISDLKHNIKDKNEEIKKLDYIINEKNKELVKNEVEISNLKKTIRNQNNIIKKSRKTIKEMENSNSWKMLSPIRKFTDYFRKKGNPKKHQNDSIKKPKNDKLLNFTNNINKYRDNSKMDIIFFSIIPYNYHYHQRPQHIANYFANKGYQVHYFNPNFSKEDIIIKEINENIHMVNLYSNTNTHISQELSQRTLKDLCDELDKYIINTGIKNFFILTEFPYWSGLIKHLKEKYSPKVIFDILDEFSGFHPDHTYLDNLLQNLIKSSDMLIATSKYLYEKVAPFDKKLKLIRNGTEFEHFNQFNSIDENTDKRPVIGYYGALSYWIDFDKIEYLAKKRPDYDILLIGNLKDSKKSYTENIEKLENVTFLGSKKYKTLPKYLKYFDVAIIPFKHDLNLIKATNPVKFYEYLSMGKKIVATEIPELKKYKNKFVYLTNDNNEFVEYIDKCVNKEDTLVSDKEKIEFAKTQDWYSRGEEIEKSILELYK